MGRRMAIGVGALAAAVLASFGVYFLIHWREVATEYHLRRLEHDPDHLEQILGQPDGSPERAAILRYIGRSEGAKQALRLYVSVLYEVSARLESSARGAGVPDTVDLVLRYDGSLQISSGPFVTRGRGLQISHGSFIIRGLRVDDDRLPILHRLVSENDMTSYEGFDLPQHEDLVFQVVRGTWASVLTDARTGVFRNVEDYVCVVRKKTASRPPPDLQAVPLLLKALASPNAGESALARKLLAELGCDPDDPVPYLARRIKDDRWDRFAIEGLIVVHAAHVPRLIAALEDDNPVVRLNVLQALIKRDLGADAAISVYLTAARDDDVTIRDTAVEGLEQLGPVAIPALLRLLDVGPGRLQYRALNALGRFGNAAKSAIPAILAWIEDSSDPYMRKKVAETVLEIEPANDEALAIAREVEERLTGSAKATRAEDSTRTEHYQE